MLRRRICLTLAVFACAVQPVVAAPIGSAITYQGRLESGGAPYHGTAALRFTLFDAEVGGTQVVGPLELVNVPVTGGVFTVNLDFGPSAFGPDARWLAVEVRTASPAFGCGVVPCTLLTPRQRIAPAPVALYALNAPAASGYWTASGVHIYNANAGNVGVGTATPTAKLHTAGDILASGSAGSIWLRPDLPGIPMIQSFSDMEIRTTTGNLRLNPISPGRVGVGVQTPAAKLHVASDTATAANNTASFEAPMIGPNASHVHFGTKGDWYIRSAASDGTGKVVIQDTLGPVGIGTNNPVGSKVHVVANDIVGLQVQNSMGNGQGILVTANTGASPRALHAIGPPDSGFAGYFAGRMHVSGNVGLGTESPLHNLHMVATQAVARLDSTSHQTGSVLELRNNTFLSTGIGAINFVNSAGLVNGQLAYLASDALTFRAGGAERARINSAGNFGIGTSAPGTRLHVTGSIGGAATNTAQFDNATIGPNASHVHFGTKGDWYIRSAANDGTGKVIIQDTLGPVGIGTNNPVGSKVHVVANDIVGLQVQNLMGNGQGILVTANTGASPRALHAIGPAATGFAGYFAGRMHVSGNVGLGTETPAHNLHMVTTQAVARLDSTSNLSGSVLELRNNTVSPTGIGAINFVNSAGAVNGQLAYLANDAFAFRAGGSERVRISSAGNVGIGTSAPGFKLHVAAGNADALFAGNLGTSPNPTTGQAALYGVGAIGARGVSNLTNGCGVVGIANNGASAVGVLGEATGGGYAGWFQGRAHVTGTLSKGGGAFKIDHPLDPENKYLYHSFVESPDMMNIYNGNVVTDDHGYATVALPDWFDTLNHDFRYQLTVVDEHDGADFVLAKVVRTVQDNQFTIRSSAPHATVSWQVTGIRQDPWAEANRIPVEEDKLSHERGFYVHPELYGFDASRNLAEAKSVLAAEPAGRAAPERSPAPRTPAARGSAEGR